MIFRALGVTLAPVTKTPGKSSVSKVVQTCCGSVPCLCQKRTCEVLLLVKKLSKLLELLNANIGVRAEFDMNETDLGFARLLAGPGDGSVALEHLFRGTGSESHFGAGGAAGVIAVL